MGISIISTAWMHRLASKNILHKTGAILDLGPQDLVLCPRPGLEMYGRSHQPPPPLAQLLGRIYDGETFRPDAAAPFYAIFGYDAYRSIDITDKRADWKMDLNEPIHLPEKFDAVTNFGTAEHVLNIPAVFRFIHDTLRPGGLGLHVLPAFGEVNHGFYNIHPEFFFDLATANGYVMEDYSYVDAIDVRGQIHVASPEVELDFDMLPIGLKDLRDHRTVWSKIVNQWLLVREAVAGKLAPNSYTIPKDYSFVALRKVGDDPFRLPHQRSSFAA